MDIHTPLLFKKRLNKCDINNIQCKLIIHKKDVVARFLRFWTPEEIKEGTLLSVYDRDEEREINEKFRLFYQESCRTYVFQKDWHKFVASRALKAGDAVQVWWNDLKHRIEIKRLPAASDPAAPSKIYCSACFNLFLNV